MLKNSSTQPSLEDILDNFGYEVVGHSPEARTMLISMTKRRITALIASAKPEKNNRPHKMFDGGYTAEVTAYADGFDAGIDAYEASLLRKLEGEG